MNKALPAQQKTPIELGSESSDVSLGPQERVTATPIPSEYHTTPDDPGRSPPPTLDEDALWRWNAFMHKQESLKFTLSNAVQLRRRYLRLHNRQEAHRELSMDAATINQLEAELAKLAEQIAKLDEQLVQDIGETVAAAPQALSRTRKRLAVMLEKHQLEFRGDGSTSDDMDNTDFGEGLDPTAAELLARQKEIDQCEGHILSLRLERCLLEDNNQSCDDESSIHPNMEAQSIADLDKKIEESANRLKSLEAELERARDIATSTECEAD